MKGKFVLVHTMKTYKGCRGTALGREWSTSCPSYHDPWHPLNRRLGGPQNHSGYSGEEKFLAMLGFESLTVKPLT
jgi:hypothetical protein